jgi:ribosome-binding protein aMBF1 (putative translation factor)
MMQDPQDPQDPQDEVKDPSELTSDEQEARQEGVSVEEIQARSAKPKPKTKRPSNAGKSPKAQVRAAIEAARKTSKSRKRPTKTASKPSSGTKRGSAVKKTSIKRSSSSPGKRGPKGWPESKRRRNAPDKGVFGRKIRVARKAKGLTQSALAKKVGIHQPVICNLEMGTHGCSDKLKAKIAKALGL